MAKSSSPKQEVLSPSPKGAGHRFAVGNTHGKGVNAQRRSLMLTQILTSQLNEVDPVTDRPKAHLLIEKLIEHALGHKLKLRRINPKTGKHETVEVDVPSNLQAIKEIFDRQEGRPGLVPGEPGADGAYKRITLILEEKEAKAL